MKKILGLGVVALLVMALVGGGTWAYFSDVETSTGNVLTAGTLDLNLDGGNTNVVKFTVSNLKPGDSDNGTWTVRNVGSLTGYLDLESCNITESVGTSTDSELVDEPTHADTTQLGNYLKVHMFVDADNDGVWDAGETDILGTNAAYAAINTIVSSYNLNLPLAATNGTNYITLRWTVDGASTDNRIQGDSVTLNMTFELQQRIDE